MTAFVSCQAKLKKQTRQKKTKKKKKQRTLCHTRASPNAGIREVSIKQYLCQVIGRLILL